MFKALAKALVGTALLPVDAVADIATLGGVNVGREKTFTRERLGDIAQNLKDATEPTR